MLPKAHLTLHSRISGSRLVITPPWFSGSWRSFLYSSSVYSCHLFLISSASVRSHWNGLLFSSPRDLSNPGIKPRPSALQTDSLQTETPGKPKNTEVGSLSLLHGIFLTQESNLGVYLISGGFFFFFFFTNWAIREVLLPCGRIQRQSREVKKVMWKWKWSSSVLSDSLGPHRL